MEMVNQPIYSGFREKKINKIKVSNGVLLAFITLELLAVYAFIKMKFGIADDGDKVLTDLFNSEAFRGSWSWFNKLNFLGAILNGIISVICFISLFCLALQTIFTLSYFCSRNFWDHVDEVKKDQLSKEFFGMKDLFSGGVGGAVSNKGIDSLINLFFIFLPNMKQKSEMGDDKEAGLTDDDTFTTWFIKTFPRKVGIMILLCAGFNGTLMQCYGMVVDAGGVIVQKVADYNLDDVVENVLNSGSNYQFSLSDDGTEKGKVLDGICKDVYRMAISKSGVTDTATKMKIGNAIESAVKSQVTDANMSSAVKTNGAKGDDITADDWQYIEYTATTNTSADTSPGSFTFNLSDYVTGGTWNTQYYVHITPVLKRKAQLHDYINN